MKRIVALLFGVLLVFSGYSAIKLKEKDRNEILALLDKQVAAWNDANLEVFMETYLNSEKLVFVGANGPTYGWQATLDNYKKSYPDKARMGHLAFKILDTSKIDRKTVFVIGRFELTREVGNLAGHFTLVIQKIKGNWVIVSDHSSASD